MFSAYSEIVFSEDLEGQSGVSISREPINNIRYADDTVIMAENIENVQFLLDQVII